MARRGRSAADPLGHARACLDSHPGVGVPAISSVQWGDQAQPWLRLSLDDVVWNVDLDEYVRSDAAEV